ncbi:ATP-binding protein [Limnochorda pilosa]|uniref:ATP-binding protein n=1 Tax=Limnochorda pilosa TaxID=1555112 RepID=UPI00083291B5
MLPRTAEPTVRHLAHGYPVVAVTGPRQSGKTTLARHAFPERPYVSLEDPDQREFAMDDPRGFLAQYPDGAILDEAQRCPQLFSYLQTRVDHDPRPGRFILTGSQQFHLTEGITQSLAGRVAMVVLLPFTLGELQGAGRAPSSLEELLFEGLYPPVHDRHLDAHVWYTNYVGTYVERDVRLMVNVRDLTTFQRFVRLCAGRTGQLLNLSALADDAGIAHNTARAWLSVLQASYIVHLLPPHHQSFNKRLVKTPKLYFLDPGLAAWLLGVQEAAQLAAHPLRGALFETWVLSELLKARFNRGLASNLFFWRDRSGHEVDVLIERGDALIPVEVKPGQTVSRDAFAALERWRALAGDTAGPGWLVYGGDRSQERGGFRVLPWREVAQVGGP